MKKRQKERNFRTFKLKLGYFLLAVSFVLVSFFSVTYLTEETNFGREIASIIEGTDQIIDISLLRMLVLGIALFIIAIFFLPQVKKAFFSFVVEVIMIAVSAIFLLGVFIPGMRIIFRISFVISAFIIFYVLYRARQRVESNEKQILAPDLKK